MFRGYLYIAAKLFNDPNWIEKIDTILKKNRL